MQVANVASGKYRRRKSFNPAHRTKGIIKEDQKEKRTTPLLSSHGYFLGPSFTFYICPVESKIQKLKKMFFFFSANVQCADSRCQMPQSSECRTNLKWGGIFISNVTKVHCPAAAAAAKKPLSRPHTELDATSLLPLPCSYDAKTFPPPTVYRVSYQFTTPVDASA